MLAKELGISRFTLHRKVNELTKVTASQFINQVRLQKAKDILRHTNSTVSDIAFQTGFNSTSYFIKCYHEYYGYPPGEVGNRENDESSSIPTHTNKKRLILILITIVSVLILSTVLSIVFKPFSSKQNKLENTIAVLPFIDDSPEDGKKYIINGLRRQILYKLELIKNLNVIPGPVTDIYNNSEQSINEIAKRLNVDFILHGAGQKIGTNFQIDLELYDVKSGYNKWTKPFQREIIEEKTFELQEEIALKVAKELEIHLTPQELERINKRPTQNTKAWKLYSLGNELFYKNNSSDLIKAIAYFKQAIEQDNEFALAYAKIAQTYFALNGNKYFTQINDYAVKSLLHDNELTQGLTALGMYYHTVGKYEDAVDFLNKALEYNPNSYEALQVLSNIYRLRTPDSQKNLELRLRMNKLNMTGIDSIGKSNFCVSLSDAFCEAGFFEEGKHYLEKALEYNPNNNWAMRNMGIEYYKMKLNPEKRIKIFISSLDQKKVSKINGLGVIANSYYALKNYSSAVGYYEKRITLQPLYFNSVIPYYLSLEQINMNSDSAMITIEAIKNRLEETEQSLIKHPFLSQYYAVKNNPDKALEHLKAFSNYNNLQYYHLWSLKDSLIYSNLLDKPEFHKIVTDMENQFWDDHERIRKNLEKKGLWPEELHL